MLDYKERIISDHKIMLGKPIVKGTRLTVDIILRKMSEGATVSDIQEMYPDLNREDVFACLLYASEVISKEEMLNMGKAS
jgi:uncharacterized protein (DUF433 family)